MEKRKIKILNTFVLVLISTLVVVLPLFQRISIHYLFLTMLIVYGLSKLINYVIDKDGNQILLCILSFLIAILYSFLCIINEPLMLPFHILAFTLILIGIEMLKLEQNYISKKPMTFNLLSFFIILALGIFSCAMIFYSSNAIIMAFYFLVISSLNLIEIVTE